MGAAASPASTTGPRDQLAVGSRSKMPTCTMTCVIVTLVVTLGVTVLSSCAQCVILHLISPACGLSSLLSCCSPVGGHCAQPAVMLVNLLHLPTRSCPLTHPSHTSCLQLNVRLYPPGPSPVRVRPPARLSLQPLAEPSSCAPPHQTMQWLARMMTDYAVLTQQRC